MSGEPSRPMKVLLFGATGMIGQGVLRECLRSPEIRAVVAVGRNASGQQHPKLREIVHSDLFDLSPIEPELSGFDACFFCLGVSSAGMSEEAYTRITHDLTLATANTLLRCNPALTFIYVSGMGTDSTEQGRSMWARVKGRTENELLRLPFKSVYMFRPGFIIPMHGIRSRTRLYRVIYTLTSPISPLLRAIAPRHVTTTEEIGLAMIHVARSGASKPILESSETRSIGQAS